MITFDYQPKVNNRFIVEFPKEFDLKSWSIQKINKPKFTDNKWENIKIEFIDVVGPSASIGLFNIIKYLKRNCSDDKILFEVKLNSLDPTGVIIEEWIIYVEEVITVNFGDFDTCNYDIQSPFMIIRPLKCQLNY